MSKVGSIVIVTVFALAGHFAAVGQTVDPAQTVAASVKDERYRIGFQDLLDIQVDRHPDLTQKVSVAPNGTIELFRLGQPIVAVCKTERELAADIENAYKEKYLRDPQVHVVAEQKSQSISVMGAVGQPGTYLIDRRYQLLEMLAKAGGPTKEAGTRLIVARAGNNSSCKEAGDAANDDQIAFMDFKIRDIQEGRQSLWLQPGDVVSVLESDVIYVYGNVNKQGAFRIKDPITLVQSLATAEGLKPNAKRNYVRILRQKPNSTEREELVFDLDQIDKRKVSDPFLQPSDIVAVSEDKLKTILQSVGGTIKAAIPGAIYRVP